MFVWYCLPAQLGPQLNSSPPLNSCPQLVSSTPVQLFCFSIAEHSSLATTSLALIFVSVAVVLAIFITMTVACICQRKLLPRQLNTTRGNSRMWEEEETPAALLQLTEQLLHTKVSLSSALSSALSSFVLQSVELGFS